MLSIQGSLLVVVVFIQYVFASQVYEKRTKLELCPEDGGDKEAGCAYWKTLGFCSPTKGYIDFMEEKCPASCSFCEARPTPPPKAVLIKVDVKSCLRAHNVKRAKHGAPPLQWDWSLARGAEEWALELANKDEFKHSPWNGQGENLYSISRVEKAPITCEDAVKAWYSEIKDYPFDSPPESVSGVKTAKGRVKVIGHFTQLVWKSTEELGVAVSYIKRGAFTYTTYIVARYTPPGNHNNQFGSMVGRLRE